MAGNVSPAISCIIGSDSASDMHAGLFLAMLHHREKWLEFAPRFHL